MNRDIFEDLFVLELANNHLGKLDRGLKIISEYGRIVRINNVRAAIKFQFRDVDNFIHKDFINRQDIRYVKKTLDTKLCKKDYIVMIDAVKKNGCIPMSTPFDEKSVDLCSELNIEIIKIASSDINDWKLIEKIATTRKPVIASTGGSSLKDLDDLVLFFEHRNIPLALNHCVSLYPTKQEDLQLNQIDFLKNRYPGHIIGFSSHESEDVSSSIIIAYSKGARTFERHVDINLDGIKVSPYCIIPSQADSWFKAYKKTKVICGMPGTDKTIPREVEIKYLDNLVRGLYAKRDLPVGYSTTKEHFEDDFYFAVPLQKGQMTCREMLVVLTINKNIKKDEKITIEDIQGLEDNKELKEFINNRGV